MSKLSRVVSHLAAGVIVSGRDLYFEYKLKRASSPIFKNRLVVWFFVVNVLFLGIDFFYIFLKLGAKQDLIPLHYNIYFGVDYIASKNQIFKLPLMGVVVLGVNYFLGWLVYKHEKFVCYILIFVSLLVSIILMFATVFILNI